MIFGFVGWVGWYLGLLWVVCVELCKDKRQHNGKKR